MIKTKVSGDKEIKNYIGSLPRGTRVVGMRAASEYFVGNPSHGLKWYPPMRAGQKYVRTFNLRNSWYINESNSDWQRVTIGNDAVSPKGVHYPKFVVGDNTQAWMHVGRWRTVTKNMLDNLAGAIRSAQSAVNALLARK